MSKRSELQQPASRIASRVVRFVIPFVTVGLLLSCGDSSKPKTAATAAPGAAPEAFNLTVQPGSIINVLIEVATKQGLWEKNNLKPNFITAQNGPAAVQALASGSVDVAANAPENFLPLVAKGVEFQMFVGQNKQVFLLVANDGFDSGGATYPDVMRKLKGKKIGITAPGSASYYTTQYLFQSVNMAASDVEYVSYSSVGGAVAAIETRQIDAGVINQPSVFIIQHDKKGQILVDLRKAGGPPLISGIAQIGMWARKDWIQSHASVIAAIRKTMAQADVFIHDPANFAVAKAIIGSQLPKDYPDAEIEAYVKANLDNIDAAFPMSAMKAWVQFDVETGALSQPLDAEKLMAPGTPGTTDEIRKLAAS
ncbi:MAG: ABC transporter substrate-binding protein [Burkholderiales bacterium]|nr:ABC transporter substrate-binding protein [Burkholderiales bacterium]